MREFNYRTPPEGQSEPDHDPDMTSIFLDHLRKLAARRREIIVSGRFLDWVQRWLDATSKDTVSTEVVKYQTGSMSPDDQEIAACLDEFVRLVTSYADNNYLADENQASDPFFTRWVNLYDAEKNTEYKVGYTVGQGSDSWITRLPEPLPTTPDTLKLTTVLEGGMTERAIAIDTKLGELGVLVAQLTEQGIPARALAARLTGLSQELRQNDPLQPQLALPDPEPFGRMTFEQ